jgi:Na+/H+-dicarboxylate symporter
MDESSPQIAAEARKSKRFRLRRVSLSTAILAGMVLGIATGIFFGEYVAFLEVIGNGFIRLLQMTILPYILVSLILGIGGLTYEKARLLAVKAGLLLLLTWVIAFAFILLMQIGFPNWESASFFSSSLVEFPPPPDFLQLYIPANPFHSLAENLIPAVVLFAIAMGVALIGVKNREHFLKDLAVVSEALMKVAGLVVRLTPIGVFAISASAAGTMSVDELSKLQVYLILFNLGCLILTFWVLPMLAAATTPFKYRDVIQVSRDALVTAFTTGNLFVVLPVLTEGGKRLFADYDIKRENTDAYVDVIIPVSFNFPNIGKLIMLFFILFAGWFSGSEMSLSAYPQFIVSGLLSFFGGVDVALPFMLDLQHIPADMYQFYVVTGIVNGRTATLLAAMNLLVFTLLVVSSLTGFLKINWRRAIIATAGSVVLLVGGMGLARVYFMTAVDNAYEKDEVLANMQLIEGPSEAVVYDVDPGLPQDPDLQIPLLQRIQNRGELRIGYLRDRIPFVYLNDQVKLVGLETELAYELAKDLGAKAVFIPVEPGTLEQHLADQKVDLVIGFFPVTPDLLRKLTLSPPYMDVTAAFVAPDYKRHLFADLEAIRHTRALTLAVPKSMVTDELFDFLVEAFPNANVVTIESRNEFFDDKGNFYDAMLDSAEGARP